MRPIKCKEQAAQWRQMAAYEPNRRVQSILIDMARTWDRLAIEAEIGEKSGPYLRALPESSAQASRKPTGHN